MAKEFSDALHRSIRTSLFFSAILLVICLPNVTIAAKDAGGLVTFSNVGASSLRVLVAIAALWAFIVFVFEYITDARPFLKQELGDIARIRSEVERAHQAATESLTNFDDSTKRIEGILEKVTSKSFTELRRTELESTLKLAFKTTASVPLENKSPIIHMLVAMAKAEGKKGAYFVDQYPKDIAKIEEYMDHVAQARWIATVQEIVEKLAIKDMAELKRSYQIHAAYITSAAQELSVSAIRLKQARSALSADRRTQIMKVRVLMAGVPATLFAFAMSYFLGRMGYGFLPDLLAHLPPQT
jgi:hypothetical protein